MRSPRATGAGTTVEPSAPLGDGATIYNLLYMSIKIYLDIIFEHSSA